MLIPKVLFYPNLKTGLSVEHAGFLKIKSFSQAALITSMKEIEFKSLYQIMKSLNYIMDLYMMGAA